MIIIAYYSEYIEHFWSHYRNVKHWCWRSCWYLRRQTVKNSAVWLFYTFVVFFCCIATEFHILLHCEIRILTELQPKIITSVSRKLTENWNWRQNPANPNISRILVQPDLFKKFGYRNSACNSVRSSYENHKQFVCKFSLLETNALDAFHACVIHGVLKKTDWRCYCCNLYINNFNKFLRVFLIFGRSHYENNTKLYYR